MQLISLIIACLPTLARSAESNYVAGACPENYAGGDVFPSKSEAGAQFRDTVSPDYSLLWDVEYRDSYKVLTNTHTDDVFVLTQCGTAPPDAADVPAGATFVTVPVTAAATTSTTYIPFLEMLGERQALKAYGSSFDYVSSPCLRKMYRDGDVASAYDAATWSRDDQLLEDLGVEVTLADDWSADAFHAHVMTDTHEEAPNAVLKTAEYVEVAGLFFNREREATEIIERTIANYLCTRDAASAALGDKAPVKVLWSSYNDAAGGWSIASATAWYQELIEAAGGELLVPTEAGDVTDSWGYTYLSTAQLEALAADAAVWISPGPLGPEVLAGLDAPPVAAGRVFDNQGPRGSFDWFERRVVEPDTLLQDLAVALHPDVFDLERKWLRDVLANEPVGGVADEDLDAACPDVAAPYVFEASDLCGSGGGGSKKKKNSGSQTASIIAAVLVTVFVVAGVLALFWCTQGRPLQGMKTPPAVVAPAPEKAGSASTTSIPAAAP
mmetsp:Transcript_1592/g.4796  ORF Transcript_1592/g.4796 Transcript_1592/m.4796 type:complete len:497 (-) Transcript_1592:115-1605(-)